MLPAKPTRSFVALAFADELLEHPELLAAYGRTFGADDDATLAILAPGADGEQVAAAFGPHADVEADLLLLTIPPEDTPAVAEHVDYVYTRRAPLQLFARLPHASDASELRRALVGEPSATRSSVVLAYAAELLADPSLLAAYGRTFGACDDVTLAIFAPGVDANEVAEALAPQTRIEPDLELLALRAEDARAVAASVDYVYSRRAPIQPFADLPHTAEPAELRRVLCGEDTGLAFAYVDAARPDADPLAEWQSRADLVRAGGLVAIAGAASPAGSLLEQRLGEDPQWEVVVLEPGCAIFRKAVAAGTFV